MKKSSNVGQPTAALGLVYTLAAAFTKGLKDNRRLIGTEFVLRELVLRLGLIRTESIAIRLLTVPPEGRFSDLRPPSSGQESADELDEAIELEVCGTLREAAWIARRRRKVNLHDAIPQWHPDVRLAVRRALRDARRAGFKRAGGVHLLIAVLADSSNRAHALLHNAGVNAKALALAAPALDVGNSMVGAVQSLPLFGLLTPDPPKAIGWIGRLRIFVRFAAQPVLAAVAVEAERQAVRLGAGQVGQVHLLLALCAIEEALHAEGVAFAGHAVSDNRAGQVLADQGVIYSRLALMLRKLPEIPVPVYHHRYRRLAPGQIPAGFDAVLLLRRGREHALRHGRQWAGTTDLLAELLADDDSAASRLLDACGVSPEEVRNNLRDGSHG